MDQSTEAPHWMQKKRTLHSQFLQRLRPKSLKLWQKFSFQHSETASILEFEKCCVSPWLLVSFGSFHAKNLGYQPVDCQYLPPLGESESQEFPGQYDKDAYEGHRVACYCSCCGKNHCETIGYHEALLNTMASLSGYPIPVPTKKSGTTPSFLLPHAPVRASNAPVVSMAMPFGELSWWRPDPPIGSPSAICETQGPVKICRVTGEIFAEEYYCGVCVDILYL